MSTNNAVNVGLSGASGTGNFAGTTSPSITTPKIITQINDTNGNELIGITATASAVNYVNVTNNATGSAPIVAALGSDTNVTLQLKGQGTGGAAIHGTGTNDTASTGYVGELISSVIASGSAVSMTANNATNITSIALTAGDWDVWGNVQVVDAGTAISGCNVWISTSSASPPDSSLQNGISLATGTINSVALSAPSLTYRFASTTTVYLTAASGTNNATGCGGLYARRRR